MKNQATARAELMTELLDKMKQFDEKYDGSRRFLQESTELLEREKPVGDSAARIEEQMKTCQVSCCSYCVVWCGNNLKIVVIE